MKLDEYSNLEEKSKYFLRQDGFLCNDLNNLFSKLEQLNLEGKHIFRGVGEAKYKLYNSAQREFIKRGQLANCGNLDGQEYYNSLIISILESVKKWNSRTISNYLRNLGISEVDDLAYLSYLQHYGFPTPLLDFTSDPFIALFFAAEKILYNSWNGFSLDSAFSLYWMNTETFIAKVLTLNDERDIPDDEKSYDRILKTKVISIIRHEIKQYQVRNNPNILNQKGCFVFNWHSVNPLEEAYRNLISQLNNNPHKIYPYNIPEEKMNCLNIHKCLAPAILDRLDKEKGINSRYIYPNLQNSIHEVINSAFIRITK